MPAHKGNKYWEFRNKHGRDYKYNPDDLWNEALKYFQWIEENPLWESVLVSKGIVVNKGTENEQTIYSTSLPKMRAMTLTGFCLFADISLQTFENYTENKDFIDITTRIREIIYSQKFEGASANLLNPNIIARDLGLKDTNVHEINDQRKTISQLFPDLDEES